MADIKRAFRTSILVGFVTGFVAWQVLVGNVFHEKVAYRRR